MFDSPSGEKLEMQNILKALVLILGLFVIYNSVNTNTKLVIVQKVRITDPKFSLLGPYNTTEYVVDDVYDQLVDIKNFTFKINPQPCQEYEAGLLLLVIVASNPNNHDKRSLIRNTWGRSIDSTKVVFLIGESDNVTVSKKIKNESLEYGDIVQGNFIDAYRNMTYKHLMGLKWVTHHCPIAKYVLKTDDDIVVNSHALRQFLTRELSPWGASGLIACQVLVHAQVQRSEHSKWKVSSTEYAGQYYPNYCAGWAILYSQDVVPELLTTAQTIPYFWIDDVHITGVVAEKIKVSRTPLATLILSTKRANLLTMVGPNHAGHFLFGPPDLNTKQISQIWKAIPE